MDKVGFSSSNFRYIYTLIWAEVNHGLDLTDTAECISHKGSLDNSTMDPQ